MFRLQSRPKASRTLRIATAIKSVFVTGGAGGVGATIPRLLEHGHKVRVLDLYRWRRRARVGGGPSGTRSKSRATSAIAVAPSASCRSDAVIHLACISNDPSFEPNPELGKSINYDAFADLVAVAKDSGVQRFIYASSSSAHGVKADDNALRIRLEPLTDYSKYKALCEEVLLKVQSPTSPPWC